MNFWSISLIVAQNTTRLHAGWPPARLTILCKSPRGSAIRAVVTGGIAAWPSRYLAADVQVTNASGQIRKESPYNERGEPCVWVQIYSVTPPSDLLDGRADGAMELRKDPITRSWVVVGKGEEIPSTSGPCLLCPGQEFRAETILCLPAGAPWQVRVIPHFDPRYRIEGDSERTAEGMYDRMRMVGAHEVIIETRNHSRALGQLSDEEIERVLLAFAVRIDDLKRDTRFKYVTVFKNSGSLAGEEWSHSHSQVLATTFVPRRVLYELRAAREWFRHRERCVFCDIARQEKRQGKRIIDQDGEYMAFCPYASRVPYETWLMGSPHNSRFEIPDPTANRRDLAALLGRVLRWLVHVAPAFHMVVHTSPSEFQTKGELSGYWRTLADDYHWHIEILPITAINSKSYGIKETYFNPLAPEIAAAQLRTMPS
jgi:UDPglucose--hexose-1-phosphate uridylyltransferase